MIQVVTGAMFLIGSVAFYVRAYVYPETFMTTVFWGALLGVLGSFLVGLGYGYYRGRLDEAKMVIAPSERGRW